MPASAHSSWYLEKLCCGAAGRWRFERFAAVQKSAGGLKTKPRRPGEQKGFPRYRNSLSRRYSASPRLPPTRSGRAQCARNQSNNSEPLDRLDGGGVGLLMQWIDTESDQIRALQPARLVGVTGMRLRRYLVLMTRVDRLVDGDFFGRSFQVPASSHWSGCIVRLRCCAPQGVLPQLRGPTRRPDDAWIRTMLVPAQVRVREPAHKC
jgi:hypothetical protein